MCLTPHEPAFLFQASELHAGEREAEYAIS